MTALYQNYQRLMMREVLRIVHNKWEAEDIFHTTIERLIDKLQELRQMDREHLVNYIIVACRYNSFWYLREKRRHVEFPFDDFSDHPDISQDQNAIESRLVQECEIEALKKVWPKLDDRARLVLESRYILNKSDAEIAAEMSISPDSVRMALTRARKAAKRLMTGSKE